LSLQNQKIFCWGRSYEMGSGADWWESYPDHLGRLLGREVDQSSFSSLMFSSSDVALGDVPFFDEHKYGVIIMRTRFDGRDVPWNVTEDNLRSIVRRLRDTGAVVVMFETAPLWDVDGQLTTTDDRCFAGTSAEMKIPHIVCDSIDNETQTAKYYEWWGDTVFKKMAEEEGAFFIPESILDCLEEGEEDCPRFTNLHPDLESDDDWHPNSMGYGVLAERMAEYLVGWGLAEYAVDLDKLSQDLPKDMAEAEEKIKVLEKKNHPPPGEIEKEFRMVEFVYGKGFLYTANRTLLGSVLPRVAPVLENFDQIQDLFAQATGCIKTLKEQGDDRTAVILSADYDRAVKVWGEYDHDTTRTYLEKITVKCPEPLTLSILGLVLLFLLLHGTRDEASSKYRI
jgi:hypothetical protein